jgi:AcrR family transcriptional regulator
MTDSNQITTDANAIDARRRMVAAASSLFAAHGYAAVSIDQVAAAIGATKGLYYHHFKAKADVLAEIVSTARAEALSAATDAVAELASDAPAEKRIEALAEGELTAALAAPEIHRVAAEANDLLAQSRISLKCQPMADAATRDREALERLYQDAYREGVRMGRLEPLPPRFAVWLIRLPILAAAEWTATPEGARTPADRVAEAVAKFAAKGLLETDLND